MIIFGRGLVAEGIDGSCSDVGVGIDLRVVRELNIVDLLLARL